MSFLNRNFVALQCLYLKLCNQSMPEYVHELILLITWYLV